ncbi:MAG: nuclease [Persephonella sp.]|nr:MAG: nuclease [Persephonella sp.]
MKIELLSKAQSLKSEVLRIKEKIDKSIDYNEVLKKWIEYKPSSRYVPAAAEDGSFNKKYYLGFYLYAVAGFSNMYIEEKDGEGRFIDEFVGDINLSVIKNTNFVDTYFRNLMFLAELKALLNLAEREKPKLLILDGTLSSRYISILPKTNWFISEEFEGQLFDIAISYTDILKENLNNREPLTFNKDFHNEVKDKLISTFGKLKGDRKDIFEAVISKIAYFEYLLLLHKLLKGLDWNPLVIGVAKTSTLTEIFNSSIPDIKIFSSFTQSSGYSIKMQVNLEGKKWEFAEKFEAIEKNIEIELRDVIIDYFYCKLRDGRDILLVELYENPEFTADYSPEDIMDMLSYYSVGNYPFLLTRADKEVRITKKDMDLIEDILGLKYELTGREALI